MRIFTQRFLRLSPIDQAKVVDAAIRDLRNHNFLNPEDQRQASSKPSGLKREPANWASSTRKAAGMRPAHDQRRGRRGGNMICSQESTSLGRAKRTPKFLLARGGRIKPTWPSLMALITQR
jgi:hypothetical protein